MDEEDYSNPQKGFTIVDYIIFLGVLTISLGIGLYHAFSGGKQRTTKEFLVGNRQLSTIPVALSILVSFVSAILVLGTPAEMYTRGTQLFMRTIGYCMACVLASLLFVPLFFSLKITSSFEYLEKRFQSKAVKLLGTTTMIAGSVFYMGLVMFTPSTALEAVTGFPFWGSIIACGVVSTFYTTLGGMKAVVWTDVFQSFVMVGGMLAIVITGCLKVGGIDRVWNISKEGGRLIFFDFNPDPTQRLSFWSLIIGGTFSTLTIFGVGQSSVQRYCSLPTLSRAKMSVFLNIPGLLLVNILASLVGLVIYAYYTDLGCDPLKKGYISNSNQLVPYFVIDVLNFPGFPGIFLGVLFSGALSSMSSILNSLAAVTWEDILKPFLFHLNEERKTAVNKLLVVIYGSIGVGVSFLTNNIGGHVLQASLSFTGATSGPTLGMFLLGALVPWANGKGAVIGCVISSAFSLWIAIGAFVQRPHNEPLPTNITFCSIDNSSTLVTSPVTFDFYNESSYDVAHTVLPSTVIPTEPSVNGLEKLYSISFLWYSALGATVTFVIGIIVSIVTGPDDPKTIDPKLIIPLFDNICCCLPMNWRKRLHCGVRHDLRKKDSPDSSSVDEDYDNDYTSQQPLQTTDPEKSKVDCNKDENGFLAITKNEKDDSKLQEEKSSQNGHINTKL